MKSQCKGNLFDAPVSRHKHLLGPLYFKVKVVLDWCNTGILFKHFPKVRVADMMIICIYLKIDLFSYVFPDFETGVPDNLFHALA